MKLHFGRRTRVRFRVASDPEALADAKMVVLERAEFLTEALPVTPGTRYRILLKAAHKTSRADAALIVFNTDQPVPADQALNWFPQYTRAVGRPFAFIGDPGPDGLVAIPFEAPPNVSQIVFGLRRWAMEGTVRVASTLVVEAAPADSQCALVDDPDALRDADYVTLSRAEVPFGDIAVDAGERYVVSAMVEDDTGRSDSALLTFTPDCPISPAEATEAFPRFTPAVGKPFTFLAPATGAGIVSTSFIAPAGASRIAIAARRWASGGTVRLGSRILAVRASVEPGCERSISLPLPSRAVELVMTPVASPFVSEPGRFDVTVQFLDNTGGVVPHAPGREAYHFSRMVVHSAALASGDADHCAPEFIWAPPQASEIVLQISGSAAHLLPAVEIGLRDIAATLADEPAVLARRLKSREAGLHDLLFGRKALHSRARQGLLAESEAAERSLAAVRSALMGERNYTAPPEREPGAAGERWNARAETKSGRRRMRILFVSPRPFGMMGTPGTYHLVEAYARHAEVCVVANSRRDIPVSVVHSPSPDLNIHEVAFGTPGYTDSIATIAQGFDPDIVCVTNYHSWYEVLERIRRDVPDAKYVLDIKTRLVGGEKSGRRQQIWDSGLANSRLLDLILALCAEDIESSIPGCTRPVEVYPLGVKIAQFSPRVPDDDIVRCKRFVFIGSYAPVRKIETMLSFIGRLPESIKGNITLDMFGGGPEKEGLVEFVRDNGLGMVVRINDSLPQDQLLNVLPAYDAGLAWVPRETFDAAPSLKMLEYMGSGLAVVASATTGHKRNLEEGFRAVLFEEDPGSFAGAIEKVHVSGHPRTDIEHNLALIKNRDWDNVVTGHLLPAFEKLLNSKDRRGARTAAAQPSGEPVAQRGIAVAAAKSSRRRGSDMRILFVSPRPFGMMGTPGTYHLVEAYARHVKIRVVASSTADTRVSIVHTPPPGLDLHEVPFGTPGYADRIATIAQEFDPDIVCVTNYESWYEIVERVRQNVPAAKYVLDIKSPSVIAKNAARKKRIQGFGIEHAPLLDLILTRCTEDVETWIPGCTRPVEIYPLGVKLSQFSPHLLADDRVLCNRFVFIGSYARERKLDNMLGFIARLPQDIRKTITLDMFGSGPNRDTLVEFIRSNDLETIVHINDSLPQEQLFKILPNYDAGLAWVPREIYDAAPSLKMLEYLGSGLVVVASSTTGHKRNLEEGFRGVLFDEDADSFAKAIEKVHLTGAPRSDIERNLELIKQRDWDNVVTSHLLPAFEKLLSARGVVEELPRAEHAVAHDKEEYLPPLPGIGSPAAGIAGASPAMTQGGAAEPDDLPATAWARLNRNNIAGTYGRMLLWSPDVPVATFDTKPRSQLRIACILSERLFDGLVHEAELLLLTHSTWKQTLQFGRVDMVLVESAWTTCTGDWYASQFERGEFREQLDELVAFARSLAIPTVFWMTLDSQYLHLYQDFATRFDKVFCADTKSVTGLARSGVHAMPLLPAIQPRRFNPIRPVDDRSQGQPGIIYDGWTDLFKFPENRAVLGRLPTEALAIIDTASMIATTQVQRVSEPALRSALKGWVHRRLLPEVYKRADAYLSFSRSSITPTQASWGLIEAAACRVPLIHLGALEPDNFRAGLVRQWLSPDEFVGDIHEIMGNPLAREVAAHPAWRKAHADHSFADRLAAICKEIGIEHDWQPFPKATLVTGTMRPHLLEKSVRQYLDQTYPNKELVIVFNGAASELAEVRAKYGSRDDIIFTSLPTECHAGSLLNLGLRQGTGQYFFRVDDDDHYGPNYIYDCMLYLRACDAEVFGKQASIFHFEDEENLYLRRNTFKIQNFSVRDLFDTDTQQWISGCGFACKSELLKTIQYPDDNNLSADTELLFRLRAMQPDTKCLMVDSLNLVVERSVDVENHTWKQPASRLKQDAQALNKRISDLMV